MSNSTFLYPNVTSLPGNKGVGSSESLPKKQEGVKGEFDAVFEKTVSDGPQSLDPGVDLSKLKTPLKFSSHANQRLLERKIKFDQQTMSKITDAVDKAAAKGVEDTLVVTDKAALIVNVSNRTVITAMDRGQLNGNVFTNIDGAVIV